MSNARPSPLWGVYRRCCVEMLRLPDVPPEAARSLEQAFIASRAADGPEFEMDINNSGDYAEFVNVSGWYRGRPFQVGYSGVMPYRIVGADAEAWQQFLATLHGMAHEP